MARPYFAGVYRAAGDTGAVLRRQPLARGDPTDPGAFLLAFVHFFGPGWRWGAVQLMVLFFLVGDVFLTGQLNSSSGARFAQGSYFAGLVVWLWLQVYSLPSLFAEGAPRVLLALRNAALMLGTNLAFSLALAVLPLLVLTLRTIFFLVTLAAGGVFVTLVGNHAVLNRLAAHRAGAKQ